jgi:hypothetical protein
MLFVVRGEFGIGGREIGGVRIERRHDVLVRTVGGEA